MNINEPPQSQRDSYTFGQHSAAEPDGYHYQISNQAVEEIDLKHVFNILAGEGHFVKKDGTMLNVV